MKTLRFLVALTALLAARLSGQVTVQEADGNPQFAASRLQFGNGTVTRSGNTAIIDNGGGGGAAWGAITGTLGDQTDLITALDLKLNVSDIGTVVQAYNAALDEFVLLGAPDAAGDVVGTIDVQTLTNKDVRKATVALAGGTTLTIGARNEDTFSADRTLTFSGTPDAGQVTVLTAIVTGATRTLTIPSSLTVGSSASITSVVLPVGTHELVWIRNSAGSDVLAHSGEVTTFDLGDTGVRISTDNDGAITFLGRSAGNDEDLTWNFDDGTANTVGISSSTGVTSLAFTGISLSANLTGAVTGNASTATALQNSRTIGGSTFDGTGNVTSFPSPGAIGGSTPSTAVFTTVDTGQGANELYDMDQNVLTTSTPTFNGADLDAGTTNVGALYGSDGTTRLNVGLSVYATGTVYTLTASDAAVDFGTTDPSLTITSPGTYLLMGRALVRYNGATYAANQTVTVKLRRTNNTAADVSNATTTASMRIITTITDTVGVMPMPVALYTTSNSNDAIAVYGSVSATPSAGSVEVTEASIVAIRLFQ